MSGTRSGAAGTIETVGLQIGPVRIAIEVGRSLAAHLRQCYGEFVVPYPDPGAPPRLVLTTLADDGPCEARVPSSVPRVGLEKLDDDRIRLLGDCQASLDLKSGFGVLEAGDGFAGMDALVRLSLSLLAPSDGWIVFHGAAVELVSGEWVLLLGSSGAGKSSAARAFLSYCDEMVLARPGGQGAEAVSTPYWNGRPDAARCRALVCLERSEVPVSKRLRGREAVRILAPHVVRYVNRDAADRALFGRLCALAAQVPVVLIRSRAGDSYPRSLGLALESFDLSPKRSTAPQIQGGSS